MNYKKYSLEQLDNWVHDAIGCAEASPQEVYDTIKNAVEEEYYIYKDRVSKCYELLALLNGNGKAVLENMETCSKDDPSPECQKAWNDFWEENYYPEEVKDNGMRPWGHSDLEYVIANSKDKVSKWIIPVEIDDVSGDYFITFPNDMLDQLDWSEGDKLEFIDNNDGSFTIKKSG